VNTARLLVMVLVSSGLVSAQRAPIAVSPEINVKGVIQRVQVSPGQGMPCLEVAHDKQSSKVFLGSMRYLIEQDFNPKVGEEVLIRGYKIGNDVVAATVTMVATGRTLKLRDENGWPLWRGGMRRGGPLP
jgi:hypothetical protein